MIYVLSDIHGHMERFDSVLRQIRLGAEDTLYILGDVIDRHPDGIRILQRIMAANNMKMLLGNHEHMMLEALGYPHGDRADGIMRWDTLALWYANGGKVTHDALRALGKTAAAELLRYLQTLPLNIDVRVGDTRYKLVHGGALDEYTEGGRYKSPTEFAVWKRWERAAFPHRSDTVVFGHTPTAHYQSKYPMEPYYGRNCIGIDCGCAYPKDGPGRLACLRLDDGKVFYSEEPAA